MRSTEPVFEKVPEPFRVTVVVVLYRMTPLESPAYRTVNEARAKSLPDQGDVRVVLWDNSPMPQHAENLQDGVSYFADESNSGLANAYNRALEIAARHKSQWLVTLDQDTALPTDYFAKMAAAAEICTRYAGIGAIVPQIEADGKSLSPNYFLLGAVPRWYRRGYQGVPRERVFAFNSAAMLSVSALEQIGGYDSRFWLDNSDAQIFWALHQHGKRVYIAGDIQVQHEFSMKNMAERMSLVRYKSALLAETAFWDLRMNRMAGLERTLRLALRLIKHRQRNDAPELRRITSEALSRRLFMSRQKRIAEWEKQTKEHLGERLDSAKFSWRRPKVSVCMAAYNGGKYVDAQLKSILPQLDENDEVVIADDGSTDDTVSRIAGFNDSSIRLYKHVKNAGVVATFEDALRCATGDILFLCDDDDVWAPTKVQRFAELFLTRPDVEIVTSRVSLIDEEGRGFENAQLNRGGKFVTGFWQNVFKNHYQGSAMALRASLLGRVLPFPRRKSFLHDAWIGTRNDALGGKTAFIDEDLLFYRRHSSNVSRRKSLPGQIRTRIELLAAHIYHAFHFTTL